MMLHNKPVNSIAHPTEHDSAYGSPQASGSLSSRYQAASQHMEETATVAGEVTELKAAAKQHQSHVNPPKGAVEMESWNHVTKSV
jgi:hypothetical protein